MPWIDRIWTRFRKLFRSESGQGMTEYVIVVALIAVAAIGAITVFGDNLRNLFATSADALAGEATGNSGARKADAGTRDSRNLKNFAEKAKGK